MAALASRGPPLRRTTLLQHTKTVVRRTPSKQEQPRVTVSVRRRSTAVIRNGVLRPPRPASDNILAMNDTSNQVILKQI